MDKRGVGGDMKGRRAAKEGNLTPEQRDLLKKQIDARMRERIGDRRGPSPKRRVS